MGNEKLDPNIPILLADADPDTLAAFGDFLEDLQLRNTTVMEKAIDVLRADGTTRFALILLGSSLTDMNPLKVMAALRAGGQNAETPIFFMHRSEEASLVEGAIAAGASRTLEKPVKSAPLRAAIEEILGKRIVSKAEKEEKTGRFVSEVYQTIEAIQSLKGEEKFEEAEESFTDALLKLFVGAVEVYLAMDEKERAGRISEEAAKIFPEMRDQFQAASVSSEDQTISGKNEKEEPSRTEPQPAGEKIDPYAPVLLAESDPGALEALGDLLKEFQFQNVTVAKDAFQILGLDDTNRFSLILLGSSLTDMTPLKVVAALRTGGNNSETPVIYLYDPGEAAQVEETVSAGASTALEKPVQEGTLRTAIEELLGKRVVLKSEEGERTARYLAAAFLAIEAVGNLRAEGVFEGPEAVFLDALLELFQSVAELYLSKGDKKPVDQLFGEAKKIFPEIKNQFQIRSGSFVERGKVCLEGKEFGRAKSEFMAALTLNEENVEASVGLGECFLGLGDMEGVKRSFERAVTSREPPKNPQTLNRMGAVACRHRLFDLALGAYDRLLMVYQLDARLYYNKSIVYVNKREFPQAMPLLNRALTVDPEFTAAMHLQEKIRYWMKGNPEAPVK